MKVYAEGLGMFENLQNLEHMFDVGLCIWTNDMGTN